VLPAEATGWLQRPVIVPTAGFMRGVDLTRRSHQTGQP